MNFYVSIFDDGKVVSVNRLGGGGNIVTATFQLAGQEFIALNGGPMYTFSPAISFFVNCETQDEVDRLWERLLDGGKAQQCGWLRGRYGLA